MRDHKPLLKQFRALLPTDFDTHPVWIGCHGVDSDEAWYDETDEATFRRWRGRLPAGPADGMLLVKASMRFADGSSHPGFLTPAFAGDLGIQQPQVFIGARGFGFWGGLLGVSPTSGKSSMQQWERNRSKCSHFSLMLFRIWRVAS
jgi:hypothetical protein